MFINDDGLQIISEEDRKQRIEFYADNCIGWTARPKHGANGFNRRGKFKKVCLIIALLKICLLSVSRRVFIKTAYI